VCWLREEFFESVGCFNVEPLPSVPGFKPQHQRQTTGDPTFTANPFKRAAADEGLSVLALGLPDDYPSSMVSSTFVSLRTLIRSSVGMTAADRNPGCRLQADLRLDRQATSIEWRAAPPNMTSQPASTGANYPYNDRRRRLYPRSVWPLRQTSDIQLTGSNYHGLQTAFTKGGF
jgi:hypothetical protein